MPQLKRKAASGKVKTEGLKAKERRVFDRGSAAITFPILVTLFHSHLAPLLDPAAVNNLLDSCANLLKQNVRDVIATKALLLYYENDSVHFGLKCPGDWHQLIPEETQGARGSCACNWDSAAEIEVIPTDMPLPRMFDARSHVLGAMCLLYEGIQPHCFKVLQMFRGDGRFEAVTMQPIVFSLAEALEKERGTDGKDKVEKAAPIDVGDTKELARLLDLIEPGFGAEFFSSRNSSRSPAHVLEAHWRGITIDEATGATSCQFCEHYAQSPLFCRVPNIPTEQANAQLRTHCAAVYQPLKKFMMQHLKHVGYVRPPRNSGPNQEDEVLDLIAGFTPGGVLCGVYVTEIGIPPRWINGRLAPGHYELPESRAT